MVSGTTTREKARKGSFIDKVVLVKILNATSLITC